MEEHIHHLSQCMIHAGSIVYNRNRLTAPQKHSQGQERVSPPAAHQRRWAGPASLCRYPQISCCSATTVPVLCAASSGLCHHLHRCFRTKKKIKISPLPLSKPSVSRAPQKAQPRQHSRRPPSGERADLQELLPAELEHGRPHCGRYCGRLGTAPSTAISLPPTPLYGDKSRFHGGLDLQTPPVPPSWPAGSAAG